MQAENPEATRVAQAGRRLLSESTQLEMLVGQAVVIANLQADVESFDWYIEQSLVPRVRNLLDQTRSLYVQLPASQCRVADIEARLDQARQKLDAVGAISGEPDVHMLFAIEDVRAMAARTLEALIFTRSVLLRLANPASVRPTAPAPTPVPTPAANPNNAPLPARPTTPSAPSPSRPLTRRQQLFSRIFPVIHDLILQESRRLHRPVTRDDLGPLLGRHPNTAGVLKANYEGQKGSFDAWCRNLIDWYSATWTTFENAKRDPSRNSADLSYLGDFPNRGVRRSEPGRGQKNWQYEADDLN